MCTRQSNLSERIQYAMLQQDMQQVDLARATGLSTGLITQIVSGYTKNPTFTNVVKIATALHVPLDYLAGNITYTVVKF